MTGLEPFVIDPAQVAAAAKTAAELGKGIFGGAFKEFGGIAGDTVRHWRLNNQIRILVKVDKRIKEKKIDPKSIDIKMVLHYIDNIAVESEESLQDLWANLITNSVDPTKHYNSIVFGNILKEMLPEEAALVPYFKEVQKIKIYHVFKQQPSCTRMNLLNIERIGLIEPIGVGGDLEDPLPAIPKEYPFDNNFFNPVLQIGITSLGEEFLQAVSV